MRPIALRSSLWVPAFAWALAGSWPHATTEASSAEAANSVELNALEMSVAQRLELNHVEVQHARGVDLAAQFDVYRAPSLSVALFTGEQERLWPIEVRAELWDVDADIRVFADEMTAVDGQRVSLDEIRETPDGERLFAVHIIPRHHIGDVIELDWELEVHEAAFAGLAWDDYLLHRFNLGPRPALDESSLRAVRADIVEVDADGYRRVFEVGERRFELRLAARDRRD